MFLCVLLLLLSPETAHVPQTWRSVVSNEHETNLERERTEFLAHLSSLISEPVRRQLEVIAQTRPASPQFTLTVSRTGAEHADQK